MEDLAPSPAWWLWRWPTDQQDPWTLSGNAQVLATICSMTAERQSGAEEATEGSRMLQADEVKPRVAGSRAAIFVRKMLVFS